MGVCVSKPIIINVSGVSTHLPAILIYFDVHQGYKVLTQSHICIYTNILYVYIQIYYMYMYVCVCNAR